MGCTRRKLCQVIFGQGFDSPRLHQKQNSPAALRWGSSCFCGPGDEEANSTTLRSRGSNQPSGLLLRARVPVPTIRNVYWGSVIWQSSGFYEITLSIEFCQIVHPIRGLRKHPVFSVRKNAPSARYCSLTDGAFSVHLRRFTALRGRKAHGKGWSRRYTPGLHPPADRRPDGWS